MIPTPRQIITAIALSAVAYVLIGIVSPGNSMVPTSAGDAGVLIILFVAILANAWLAGAPTTTPSANSGREAGTVKWFNVKKGYGFITRDQGDDVFVHYRNIEGGGRRGVAEGQRVSFVVVEGDKGPQAEEVTAS